MAFPYYPNYQNPYMNSYYPIFQQQNQAQQMPQQQQPQSFNQTVPQTSMIWVSGEREAQMYPVAPNNAVTLWSQTESVVYVKQADATGKPTIKVYDLVERDGAASLPDKQDGKSDEYVRKSDYEAVMGAINAFSSKVALLTADIEAMKGDMYGFAGKKKTTKKVEVVEDDE